MNFYHFLKFTVGKPEVITNWLFSKQRPHQLTIVFLWFFLTEIQTFRTQLAKNSLTFDKFSVMKQKRWSLKDRLCFLLSEVFDAVAVVVACMLNLHIKTEHWTKWSARSQLPCIVCTNQNSAAGLAQSVERSTAEREVAGSIPGAGSIHKVLK